MRKGNTHPERDIGAALMLLALVLAGMIPWLSVLFGRPPAYSAELGAVVTVVATPLLVGTLWEMRRQRATATRDAQGKRD